MFADTYTAYWMYVIAVSVPLKYDMPLIIDLVGCFKYDRAAKFM